MSFELGTSKHPRIFNRVTPACWTGTLISINTSKVCKCFGKKCHGTYAQAILGVSWKLLCIIGSKRKWKLCGPWSCWSAWTVFCYFCTCTSRLIYFYYHSLAPSSACLHETGKNLIINSLHSQECEWVTRRQWQQKWNEQNCFVRINKFDSNYIAIQFATLWCSWKRKCLKFYSLIPFSRL